jgi:aminoglycoside 3-N-acetyltransferase
LRRRRSAEGTSEWLGDRQRIGSVGHATARLAEARVIVEVAVAHLSQDPLVFLCSPESGCEECDLARASIP